MVATPPIVVGVSTPLAAPHRHIPAPPIVAEVGAGVGSATSKAVAPPIAAWVVLPTVAPQSQRVFGLLAPVRIPT